MNLLRVRKDRHQRIRNGTMQLRGGPRFLTRRDPGQLRPSRQRARGSHRRTSPSLCGIGGNLGSTTVRDASPARLEQSRHRALSAHHRTAPSHRETTRRGATRPLNVSSAARSHPQRAGNHYSNARSRRSGHTPSVPASTNNNARSRKTRQIYSAGPAGDRAQARRDPAARALTFPVSRQRKEEVIS
ncbi:hypothetical protein NDU88_006170 [Pleurodeles waltl]|uniref:Uncharacterized protein n=1 Tax=Pleurodeles waltl TaxID=8319 RepID=A0AAV7SNW6_PLEWA|nr:hypothetical protein NDU88_006170 [Pleurodeles waltl]